MKEKKVSRRSHLVTIISLPFSSRDSFAHTEKEREESPTTYRFLSTNMKEINTV